MISEFYKELIVVILGMLPISEVRGAVPAGILIFNFHPLKAYFLSVLGNLLPIVPLFWFLNSAVDFLMHRWYWANRFFTWLFSKTRQAHGDHFHTYKWAPLALFIFVAVPLPLTGAWSGIVAAVVFGIPFWQAILAVSLGVMASAGIVTLIASGLLAAFKVFL
jgi:uncharacterized membrane protein